MKPLLRRKKRAFRKPRLIGARVVCAKQDRERNLKANLRHG